jgi:hypothetical protein
MMYLLSFEQHPSQPVKVSLSDGVDISGFQSRTLSLSENLASLDIFPSPVVGPRQVEVCDWIVRSGGQDLAKVIDRLLRLIHVEVNEGPRIQENREATFNRDSLIDQAEGLILGTIVEGDQGGQIGQRTSFARCVAQDFTIKGFCLFGPALLQPQVGQLEAKDAALGLRFESFQEPGLYLPTLVLGG